jgi:hypothetical protein
VLRRLRNWLIIRQATTIAVLLTAEAIRRRCVCSLDVNQLPRPFQISALGNKDWSLASEWKTWLTLPSAVPLRRTSEAI